MIDASLVLPGGRTMAFTDLGAPDGAVVVYAHGAPGSRLDPAGHDAALADVGVRMVATERPGYGRSSPQPERRRDGWTDDLTALADHLGVERFAVVGYSSGGPYAVAAAALLPDRVSAAGVVAGVTDMGWSRAWDGIPDGEAALMREVSDAAGAVAWCEERFGADGGRLFEDGDDLTPGDLAVLQDETLGPALVASMGEAFRQGVVGYAHDIVAQREPWSFDPAAIVVPVEVIHGDADTLVPVAHGRHTAEVVAGAELTVVPGAGHLTISREIPALAARLAAAGQG